jgi:hypothetical protein
VLRFHKERLAVLARRIPAAGRRPRRYRHRTPAGYLLAGPIVEAVEWPGLQPLHSTPPWPDANRLAHETIHEQTRQDSTGRDRETGKLLLRHTTADSRLRGEKDPQRLRAWTRPAASPSGSCQRCSGHRGTGLTLRGELGSRRCQVEVSVFSPAVPPACHQQRSRAVCSGQSGSLQTTVALGAGSLTGGGGGGRNCMACKRSWACCTHY